MACRQFDTGRTRPYFSGVSQSLLQGNNKFNSLTKLLTSAIRLEGAQVKDVTERESQKAKRENQITTAAAALTVILAAAARQAFAYIGPGAGIGAIGTFFAVIGAVVLLIVGFLWYPVKRMLRKKKPAVAQANIADGSDTMTTKQRSLQLP